MVKYFKMSSSQWGNPKKRQRRADGAVYWPRSCHESRVMAYSKVRKYAQKGHTCTINLRLGPHPTLKCTALTSLLFCLLLQATLCLEAQIHWGWKSQA